MRINIIFEISRVDLRGAHCLYYSKKVTEMGVQKFVTSKGVRSDQWLTLNWYCYSLQLDCSEGVGVWFLLTDMISYCHIEWCSKLSPRDMKKQALQVWRKQFTRVRKPFVKRGYFFFFFEKVSNFVDCSGMLTLRACITKKKKKLTGVCLFICAQI